MRKLQYRLTALALALVLPLAMTTVASAAPLQPLGERPDFAKVDGAVAGGKLGIAAIPGATALPASPFAGSVAGSGDTISTKTYSFGLGSGQVLKATITPTTVGAQMMAAGFTAGATSPVGEDFPIAAAEVVGGCDLYIPAEEGAGTYYLSILNFEEVATNFTVTWEVLSGRAAAVPQRIAGADRYAVAEAVAAKAFPGWAGVTDVIIASGDDRAMADPLSAAALAGAYRAPILLVKPILVNGKLPTQTERAITNIKNANGGKVNIHVIGGTVTVPGAVYNRVSALKGTGTIERITGADRYALSAVMAKRARDKIVANGGTVQHVLIANGETAGVFYDALAASAISYNQGIPMMLSRGKSVPTSVQTQLNTTFASTSRYLVNSPVYLNSAVRTATRADYNIVYGDAGEPYDRYAAAVNIADWAYLNGLLGRDSVAVANKLPDALTGGVAMGELGAPILYTPASAIDFSTELFLYWNKGAIQNAYVLGGTSSITAYTFEDIAWALEWPLAF